MKNIFQTEIFNLIAKSNHTAVSNEEFSAALDVFAAELSVKIDATIDYALAFRTLSAVCVRLHTLHRGELPSCEAGKNVETALIYLDAALEVVNSEKQLLRDRLDYPKSFIKQSEKQSSTVRWLANQTQLGELLCILYHCKILGSTTSLPLSFAELIRQREAFFNIKLGSARELKRRVLNRNDITQFTESLIKKFKKEI